MKSILKLSLVMASTLAILTTPAIADETSELEAAGVEIWKTLPRSSEMIRHPGSESYEFYGSKPKTKSVSAKDIPGGKAVQIKVKAAGKNPWDLGANVPTQLATGSGDVLVAVIYARAKELPQGASNADLPIHIQEQGGKYKQYGSQTVKLTQEWGRYVVYGTLDRKFKKGGVGAAVHFATAEQVIELGPVYLMNMGPGAIDKTQMPSGQLSGL